MALCPPPHLLVSAIHLPNGCNLLPKVLAGSVKFLYKRDAERSKRGEEGVRGGRGRRGGVMWNGEGNGEGLRNDRMWKQTQAQPDGAEALTPV